MGSAVARHRESTGPSGAAASQLAGRLAGTLTNRNCQWASATNRSLEKPGAEKNLSAGASSNGTGSLLSPAGDETRKKAEVKKPAISPLPPPPALSCLVPSKHLPKSRTSLERELPPLPNTYGSATKRVHSSSKAVPRGSFEVYEGPGETGGRPCASPTTAGSPPEDRAREKNDIVGKGPSKSQVRSNESLRTFVESDPDEKLPSLSTRKKPPQSSVSNSVAPAQFDGRPSRFFADMIAHGAIPFRDSNLLWFNVDYDRRLLKRRDHCYVIWCPLEEIAVSELDEVPKEAAKESVASPIAEGRRASLTKQQKQNQSKQENATRPRIRPILPSDVPHRMQLAKKALEDNVIFIYSRAPKLF